MGFPHSIIGRIHTAIQQMKITSAGGKNPVNNEVKQPFNISEVGLDEEFSREVVRVIKQEIKIQMTEFQENPPTPASKPDGSTITKVQGDIAEVMNIVKNPGGFVATGLRVLPPVAAAFFAKEIADYILTELTREGSLLDVRWKRQLDKEQNSFLNRQQQRNTQIGLRQVITTSQQGFIKLNGAGGTESNIRQIRDGGVDGNRLARVDITDHTKGLFGN